MRKSWLPEGGKNLFQEIKKKRKEAEKQGIEIVNMAIGQPQGPAFASARIGAAMAVLSGEETMHEYQDNSDIGVPGFSEKFVLHHLGEKSSSFVPVPQIGGLGENSDIKCLPTAGIKPILGLIILACNSTNNPDLKVATTTKPGYPTPKKWCEYLNVNYCELPLNPDNGFLFSPEDIPDDVNLLHINYPHNPSGAVANREWWKNLCDYCQDKEIRIFNDGAYAMLAHNSRACTLTSVAVDYSELSWVEAFSASKAIGNGTGWRVAALVGSNDFVEDIGTIKGNTDSGGFAPAFAGTLECLDYDMASVTDMSSIYHGRILHLMELLKDCGMQEAVYPGAGFFTLWKTPTWAFDKKIGSAEEFNFLMIKKTGVMGVHFDPYIRYAVVGRIEYLETTEKIAFAFSQANVKYD